MLQEKLIYILIPFYIFTHENRLQGYEDNEEKLKHLLDEYTDILTRLDTVLLSGEIGEFDKRTIVELSEDVLKQIAKNYQKVQKTVEAIMGGFIIETKVKKEINEARNEGVVQTLVSLIKDKLISLADAAKRMDLSEDDFKQTALKFGFQL